jgi:integrase
MQAWPDIYLADAFEEFRRDSEGLSPVSLRNRHAVHKRLLREEFEFCMNTPLHALTGQNVTELLERMNLTDATYNKVLSELFALCSWAQRKQYIDPDRHPLRHVRRKVYAETELHCLQPQQLQALLLTACTKHNPDVAVHVALGAFAGIRPYEARRLRWRDVDTEDSFISVRGRASKTGGTRHITLRPVLRAWLDYLCPPASRKPDSLLVAKCSTTTQSHLHRNAGMKKWPHDVLRHSFASYAIKGGTPLHEVQADMGHVGLQLLRTRYLNMAGLTKAGAEEWWSMTPDRVLP